MNGQAAKMLRKMQANDKKSKRLWQSLTPAQKERVTKTYNSYEQPEGARRAVVTFMQQIGSIKD